MVECGRLRFGGTECSKTSRIRSSHPTGPIWQDNLATLLFRLDGRTCTTFPYTVGLAFRFCEASCDYPELPPPKARAIAKNPTESSRPEGGRR